MSGPKQPRAVSLIEAIINISVGFGIGLMCQLVFLPPLGGQLSLSANLIFAAIMTVVSIARSYGLRRLFEYLHIRTPLSPAMLAIIAERRRQIEVEGWTQEHDDTAHLPGDLAQAGACYAADVWRWTSSNQNERDALLFRAPGKWPWAGYWWKPQGFRRDLVRAGALIVAELEKHDRARMRKEPCATKQS